MSNFLDTVIERGLLTLFIQRCEKSMSITDEMLKDAVNTAEAIQKVRGLLDPETPKGEQSTMFNSGIQAPLPIPTLQRKTPRVSSNEGLLTAENEALKKQCTEKEEETQAVTKKLSEVYAIVEAFREDFIKSNEEISDKVFNFQHSVYAIISDTE